MNWIKLSLVALFSIVVMVSCEYEFIKPIEPVPPEPGDTISFSAEVLPIFTEQGCNVSGCHGGNTNPNLLEENAYSSISNGYVTPGLPEQSEIYTEPDPLGGHFAKYSSDQSAKVKFWIEQGALDN